MRLSNAFQASFSWLRAICRRSHFQNTAAYAPLHGRPNLRFKFEVARQASSPNFCASVRAVSWADEAEQRFPG